MSVVALRSVPTEARVPAAFDGHVARLEVFDDLAAAEPHWRALECALVLATPYQHFEFLAHWQRHVGEAIGMWPFIVIGFNNLGTPLFLWPLGVRVISGLKV